MKRARKKPKQERSRFVVDAIVTATMELLEKSSRDRISMRDIAKRAGVGVGSIYDYFEGRESIFASIVERLTRESFEQLFRMWEWDDVPLEGAIVNMLDAVSKRYLASPPLFRMAFRTLVRLHNLPTVLSEQARFAERMSVRFEREMPDVPPDTVRASVRDVTDMVMAMLAAVSHRDNMTDLESTIALLRRSILGELAHLRAQQHANESLES
ncbi:MAG: TetR/AcrR family transcriptional regulator [Myxococcota bacterium]